MSTANKKSANGREMIRIANDLDLPIEFEYEIHKPVFKPLLSRRRKARKCNPRRVTSKR